MNLITKLQSLKAQIADATATADKAQAALEKLTDALHLINDIDPSSANRTEYMQTQIRKLTLINEMHTETKRQCTDELQTLQQIMQLDMQEDNVLNELSICRQLRADMKDIRAASLTRAEVRRANRRLAMPIPKQSDQRTGCKNRQRNR